MLVTTEMADQEEGLPFLSPPNGVLDLVEDMENENVSFTFMQLRNPESPQLSPIPVCIGVWVGGCLGVGYWHGT